MTLAGPISTPSSITAYGPTFTSSPSRALAAIDAVACTLFKIS
jgi:hypothetical protein